jgi:peptide chain release factor 2
MQTLEAHTHQPNFWNDQQEAQRVTRKIGAIRSQLDQVAELDRLAGDLQTYLDLLAEDPNDALFNEAVAEWKSIAETADNAEIRFLLNDKFDAGDALLTIHPGAGGTESQDWAEMLLRMYKRWAEKNKYGFVIVDYLPGEEAGLKSVTVEVTGNLAYGYLKTEKGVHRLVRISPFNAQGKRQTSFASVFVYPVIDDEIEIDINPKDLKIDTFRSSSAGGQHVNVTDSAVRITHLPTNIVVTCQNERSQIKNRATAMKILRSRLIQYYEEEREKERQKTENEKTEIGWGNQIRSYVFHPYQLVKDHRTDFEVGNTALVMDGGIDGFMTAFLKLRALNKKH